MDATQLTRKGRRLGTVLARSLLVLTLLPQLAVLWVLHRPSPTEIPAGLAAAIAEEALPDCAIRVGRATIDRQGVVRLDGARLDHPARGELRAISGRVQATFDAVITPPWRDWILLGSAPTQVRAQGRVTGGPLGRRAILDRVDLRVRANGETLVRASAADFHLRALVRPTSGAAADGPQDERAEEGQGLNERGRRLDPGIRLLEALREFTGGAEVVVDGTSWRAVASGRRRGDASLRQLPEEIVGIVGGGQLAFGVGRFAARATGAGEEVSAWVELGDLQLGPARLGSTEVELRTGKAWRLAASDLSFAGAEGGTIDAEGRMLDGRGNGRWSMEGRLAASLGESRLSSRFAARAGEVRVTELNLATTARDATRWPGVGEALRRVGVDFGGRLELADGQVLAEGGAVLGASGRFALTKAGWGDIRPSSIRPERAEAAVSGAWNLSLEPGEFRLTDLDIAGLRGSITGGLAKGEPFEVRLTSTPGNPVHPGCLNSLLGGWWADLWNRFDLTTGGEAPHADVRVLGKWGSSAVDRVEVAATLGNFGFMGARFVSTAVRVEATPAETMVWIDELRGAREGKSVGTARGRLRWDWTRPDWAGHPEIAAEGDLDPVLALRLHDSAQAQRLRGWSLGLPWTKVRISPGRPTEIELSTGESSRIEGVVLGPMQASLSLPTEAGAASRLRLGAAFAGGRLEADIEGNLRDDNRAHRVALREVDWHELQKTLPALLGKPAEGSGPGLIQLSGDFQGRLNLEDPAKAAGRGTFHLKDPSLKTVHLLGGVSRSFSSIGLDFSSYPLTEALGAYELSEGKTQLLPLRLQGPDSALELRGSVDLNSGRLDLKGEFRLRKSSWGVLGILNPNRLITSILNIRVEGTLQNPKTRVEGPSI